MPSQSNSGIGRSPIPPVTTKSQTANKTQSNFVRNPGNPIPTAPTTQAKPNPKK